MEKGGKKKGIEIGFFPSKKTKEKKQDRGLYIQNKGKNMEEKIIIGSSVIKGRNKFQCHLFLFHQNWRVSGTESRGLKKVSS